MTPGILHYDPRCSRECRARWANRETHIDLAVWRAWGWLGLGYLSCSNLEVLADLSLKEHRRIRSRFLAALRRWALEHNGRVIFRAVSEVSRDGGLHDHHIAASDAPLSKPAMRKLYAEAAGVLPVRVLHDPVRDLDAFVRYQYKATAGARDGGEIARLHKPSRLPVVWGSKHFTPGGSETRKAQWRAYVRDWKASNGSIWTGDEPDPSEVPEGRAA